MSDKNSYSLREIFERMTLDLIMSMRRTLQRHLLEQEKEGFVWEQWQLSKLRSLEKFRLANREIIGRYSQEVEETIADVLGHSFRTGEQRVDDELRYISELLFPGDTRYSRAPVASPEQSFFGMNEKKLRALQETVTRDMSKAQHAVLRYMDDTYRQTIYKTQIHMASGAKTLRQAVDMSTKDFLDQGINCVSYRDGRRVSIDSYAEMALRTASQRATFMGEGKKRNEWGVYTVLVSAHATSCDLCMPWQGKVVIDDVYSNGRDTGKYPLLSTAMKEGLLHPNCRHTQTTYFPGITLLPKVPSEETARRNYEAEQRQRYMERQVRRYKRRTMGALDPENQAVLDAKTKEWQGKLREHLGHNPHLRRSYSREKVKTS